MNRSTNTVIRILLAGIASGPLFSAGLAAQTTVKSGPVGVVSDTLREGYSGLAFPLIAQDAFVGIVASNSDGALLFAPEEGDIGSLLDAAGRYYFEVATGPLEGERLDVDAAATIAAAGPSIAIDLGDDTNSTLPALGADALAGARVILRPHVTLATLQSVFHPGLRGDRHPNKGDSVLILDSDDFESWYLGEDGESWYEVDERGNGHWSRMHRDWCRRHDRHQRREREDFRDLVIPPDVSILVRLDRRHTQVRLEGIVRTNAFRKNLERGTQSFASGFPVDLSPVEIGAFVDSDQAPHHRWRGDDRFPFADHIQIVFSGRRPLATYYLRGDGHTWRSLSRRDDVSNDPIIGTLDMILVKRRNPDPSYLVPRPFDL
jgi:hypothetical protein